MSLKKAFEKAEQQPSTLARELMGQAAMGVALGLGFCLLITMIDPSHITSLITHNAEPETTAIILVSFFTLIFGVGATLTGLVLIEVKRR
jgi:hypothetical protein